LFVASSSRQDKCIRLRRAVCIQPANPEPVCCSSSHRLPIFLLVLPAPCALISASDALPDLLVISICYAESLRQNIAAEVPALPCPRPRESRLQSPSNAFASSVFEEAAGGFAHPVSSGARTISPRGYPSKRAPVSTNMRLGHRTTVNHLHVHLCLSHVGVVRYVFETSASVAVGFCSRHPTKCCSAVP
jgi:hypothetical protein